MVAAALGALERTEVEMTESTHAKVADQLAGAAQLDAIAQIH